MNDKQFGRYVFAVMVVILSIIAVIVLTGGYT